VKILIQSDGQENIVAERVLAGYAETITEALNAKFGGGFIKEKFVAVSESYSPGEVEP
jgi:hypothetical protein